VTCDMTFSDGTLRHRAPVKKAPKIVEETTTRAFTKKEKQKLSPHWSMPLFFAVVVYLTVFHGVDSTRCLSDESAMEHDLKDANPSSSFLLPNHLKPGAVLPFVWKEDGTQVDDFGRLVGLPPQLTAEILSFCEKSGLLEAFWAVSYENSQTTEEQSYEITGLKGGYKGNWTITNPGKNSNWPDSNMRWFDPTDEIGFEETLQVLKHAGFDTVLEAVGNEFNSEGLMIAGLGFIAVSQASDGDPHSDDPGSKDELFNFLFPLILPENDKAELYIGNEEDRIAPLNYTKNFGFLLSGDTTHAT